jgi:hypothetical protein
MGPLIRRHLRELGFAVLAVAALALGGGAALDGASLFVAALTPGMTAQAQGAPRDGTMRLALSGFGESRHAPQVLYPVVARAMPGWLRAAPARKAPPLVAICIDDLGEDIAGTEQALRLPKAVALAFLPYAAATPDFAARAREEGHTVLAHVPMQPLGRSDPGPMALEAGMAPDEILRRLNWSLARVPGAAGVNNHEGSRFTSDAGALAPVMAVLKARGLFFFDSRTSAGSKGQRQPRHLPGRRSARGGGDGAVERAGGGGETRWRGGGHRPSPCRHVAAGESVAGRGPRRQAGYAARGDAGQGGKRGGGAITLSVMARLESPPGTKCHPGQARHQPRAAPGPIVPVAPWVPDQCCALSGMTT